MVVVAAKTGDDTITINKQVPKIGQMRRITEL
jgi:hypothetical protein